MRTSITLDSEIYSFVSAYAEAKGLSLSAAISELVRRAENASEATGGSTRLKTSPYGYLVIGETGDTLTPEMVKLASEDELV